MEPREARWTRRGESEAAGSERLDEDLRALTPSQREAVESDAASLCIVAGAGSGKTRVLTLRIARRIRDGSAEADHSVACTFTRKAALELRGRLRRYGVAVSERASASGVPGPGVRAGTIHRLALGVLRRHALDTDRPLPVVADDRFARIRKVVADPAIAAAVDAEIGWAKARALDPDTYRTAARAAGRPVLVDVDRVAQAFTDYQSGLDRARRLDLDDILLRATELIVGDAGVAERTRWRYRHLFVDEFQDINPAQYALVEALRGGEGDLCVVGDPNQAIYGWNGADPTLLGRITRLVEGIEVVHLGENHRSTPQVVAAASAALGAVVTAPPRSAAPDGPRPTVTAYDDAVAEAEGIASVLLERHAEDVPWSEQAVLARTHDQLVPIGQALRRAGVPFEFAAASGTARGAADAVDLATFHRAKGLEWTSVCVAGVEDGYVPIVHAGNEESTAEERRLLYVAMTRAARDLHCSWSRTRVTGSGRGVERRPSPWLADVVRVATTGTGRIGRVEGVSRVAALRAALHRPSAV